MKKTGMFNRYDLFLACFAFVFALTVSYLLAGGHAGFNPDGAAALHSAQNLADGKGLVTMRITPETINPSPRPVVTKPPLFPLATAVLVKIGVSPKTGGWTVTLLSFAFSAMLMYLLGRFFMPHIPAIMVAILFVIQMSGLGWSVLIHEEWLFIMMTLLSLLILVRLRAHPEVTSTWVSLLLGMAVAAAVLSSYQGVPLVLTICAILFFDASVNRCSWRQLLYFTGGMVATGLLPLIRFLYYTTQGIAPAFIGGTEPAWQVITSGLVHTLQIDFSGQLFVWLGSDTLTDQIPLIAAFVLLLGFLLLAARQRNLAPISVYIICYVIVLVIQAASSGFPFLEPRYVIPIEGLLLLVIATIIWRGLENDNRGLRTVSAVACAIIVVVFLVGQLQLYDEYSEQVKLSSSREYCPSPQTLEWVQENITPGSVIISPQCGYQLLAETNDYYWLPIPPADEYITSRAYHERWDESDILRISQTVGAGWIVILLGERGDPKSESPGYGEFVTNLMDGNGGTEHIRQMSQFEDGVVYRIYQGSNPPHPVPNKSG